jgi:hypothetical protein
MAARRGTLPVRNNTNCTLLKITVRRSARLLRNRGIPASNIGSETTFPYVNFSRVSKTLPENVSVTP